ncbi:putative lachesin precursor, partial [Penaeus vannamei]
TKYQVLEMVDLYRVTMKLAISNFTQNDAGQYKCVSTNSLGKADTSIRLYVIEVPTARTTTEHQSYVYPTTPHSKAVDTLDLLRRDGHQVLRPREGLGPGGVRVRPDGSVVGLGVVELSEKEQSRQRQRQRLELGEGRLENGGYLGGGAGYTRPDGGRRREIPSLLRLRVYTVVPIHTIPFDPFILILSPYPCDRPLLITLPYNPIHYPQPYNFFITIYSDGKSLS